MRRVGGLVDRSQALFLIGRVVPAALTFALIPFVSRLLGPDGYGSLAVYLALVAAFSALAFGWCEPVAVREFVDNDGGTDSETIRTRIGSLVVATSLVGCFLAAVSAIAFSNLVLVLVVLCGTSYGVGMLCVGVGRSTNNGPLFLRTTMLVIGGRSVGGLVGVAVGFGVPGYLGGWLVLAAAGAAGGLHGSGFSRPALSIRKVPLSFLRYAIPVSAVGTSIFLLQIVDRLLLALFIDDRALGIYALGYSMVEAGIVLLFSITFARQFPALLRTWSTDLQAGERRLVLLATVTFSIPLAGIPTVLFYGQALMGIMGGAAFVPPSSLFLVLVVIGLSFYGLAQWLSVDFQAKRLTGRWCSATYLGVLANISVVLIFGHLLGLVAGGVATLVAYVTMASLMAFLSGPRIAVIALRSSIFPATWCAGAIGISLFVPSQPWRVVVATTIYVTLVAGTLFSRCGRSSLLGLS